MTTREAYIFGWVFGRLNPEGDTTLAAMRPYSANAQAISAAHRSGILKGDLNISIHAPRAGCDKRRHLFFLSAKWNSGTCSRKHRIWLAKCSLLGASPNTPSRKKSGANSPATHFSGSTSPASRSHAADCLSAALTYPVSHSHASDFMYLSIT